MKFGRLGKFIFSNNPQVQVPSSSPSNPQQPPAQQVSPGLGQQHSTDTSKLENPDSNNSVPIDNTPKKKDLFKELHNKHRDSIVFSTLSNLFAINKLIRNRPEIQWREEYTKRLPKKPNFYRFIGFNTKTNTSEYFLLIRGDVPTLEDKFRVVIDKFGHAGTAQAKYFQDANTMLNWVNKTYGIDTSNLEITMPDKEVYVKALTDALKFRGASAIHRLLETDFGGTEEENKEIIERIIKSALSAMKADKAVGVMQAIEESEYPIDLTAEKKKYAKYGLMYHKNKEDYKKLFDEQVPLVTRDSKAIDAINRFYTASTDNNKFYTAMVEDIKIPKVVITNETFYQYKIDDFILPNKKPLVIPPYDFVVVTEELANKSEMLKKLVDDGSVLMQKESGVYLGDFARYLQQMNALNETILQVAAEFADAGTSSTLELVNNTDQAIVIGEIDFKLQAGETISVTSEVINKSRDLQQSIKEKRLIVKKGSVKDKWVGFLNRDELKKTVDYLRASVDTYEKYKGKPVKPFEYNLKLYEKPETGWRPHVTDGTFRAELDMGAVYLPAPKQFINDKSINEHFSENACIAFAFVHEQVLEDKKIWIIDEYQSDLVQQIGNLSDNPEPLTWYNPEGKSKKERYQSTTFNYYKDWYRVFLNKLIKKAKGFNVDELWLIRGQDIFNYWNNRGAFGEVDEIEQEKKLRLFRRVYDNTAIEYSQHAGIPDMQPLFNRYDELVLQISNYYDAMDKIDMHIVLTTPRSGWNDRQQEKARDLGDLTEEQTKKKLEGFKMEETQAQLNVDIKALKKELDDVMEKVSVIRKKTKDLPPEIYNGKYHIIDLNKVPDVKLATPNRQLTKYATFPVVSAKKIENMDEWHEKAYRWITESWVPSYVDIATQQGEKIMSENKQKQVALEWFWERQVPKNLKTNRAFLLSIRDYLRERFNMPELDYSDNIKLYIEGINLGRQVLAWDNPDPSAENAQTSPMEENMDNRIVDPAYILYRKQKGRGAPMGNPSEDGELKCNLPASLTGTASDVIERYLINREKQHATEPQIRKELKDKGVSEEEVDKTYKTRDKNLYKEIS